MKKTSKILALVLVILFTFGSLSVQAYSTKTEIQSGTAEHLKDEIPDEKVDSEFERVPDIKDDFADDTVIVILKHKSSEVNAPLVPRGFLQKHARTSSSIPIPP